jgi:hypothetical protein
MPFIRLLNRFILLRWISAHHRKSNHGRRDRAFPPIPIIPGITSSITSPCIFRWRWSARRRSFRAFSRTLFGRGGWSGTGLSVLGTTAWSALRSSEKLELNNQDFQKIPKTYL